jgi:hypothetical protein
MQLHGAWPDAMDEVRQARDRLPERFLRVAALQDPPPRMFRPTTALRVALGYRRRRRAPAIETTTGMPTIAPRA